MADSEALAAAIASLVVVLVELLRLEVDRRRRRAGKKRTRYSDRRRPR